MGNSSQGQKILTVVLGGGRGTRLLPLTQTRCKAAVPIGGKYRLIDIVLSNCIYSELHHIFVLTQYLGRSLQRHIIQTYRFDQFSDGFVEILSAEQTLTDFVWYEGTADAVRKNLARIEHFPAAHVLILSADHLYRMDYRKLIEFHTDHGADLTVAGTLVGKDEAPRMGILKVDETKTVRALVEKPKNPAQLEGLEYRPEADSDKRYLASMGVYLFRKRFLLDILSGTAAEDFGAQIIPEAISRGKVCVYKYDGYWVDVGTVEAFFNANMDFTTALPRFDFYLEQARVFTRPRFLPPAKLVDCKISRSIIGEGSVIEKAEITDSIVGIRSVIRGFCHVTRSVLMGNDYYEREYDTGFIRPLIGSNVKIERAIIDKNVVIGEGSEIRGSENRINKDAPNYSVRDGIVVIPSNTVIPPGTKIYASDSVQEKELGTK